MVECTGNNQVVEAIQSVLDKFPQLRENLVEELTVAAKSGDYSAISEITSRLKRADVLQNELDRLQEELLLVFHPESVKAELSGMVSASDNLAVPVPDEYELCSPTLQALRTLGGNGRRRDITQTVIEQMHLSDEVTQVLHEDGPQTELEWQLGWARTILKTCGMVDNPQQGLWELTESGSLQNWLEAVEFKALYRQHLNRRRQHAEN